MKDYKTWQKIISSLAVSFIPAIIITLLSYLLENIKSLKIIISANIIAYLIAAFVAYVVLSQIENCRFFRKYYKFEGIWIEIIHNTDKPISICRLKFDKNYGYSFSGTNFVEGKTRTVKFRSIKFVNNGNDAFFFITSSNQFDRPEAFAKIHSLSLGAGGFYEGDGYFFDVSTVSEPKVKQMELFKFDDSFCKSQLQLSKSVDIMKLTDKEIYDYIFNYTKDNYDITE